MSFLAEIFVFFLTTNLLSETKWQWSCVDHLVQTQLNNGLNIISLSLNSLEMCQHRPCRMSFSSSTHGSISGVKDGSSSSCYHGTEETQGSTHSKGMIRCYTWFLFTPPWCRIQMHYPASLQERLRKSAFILGSHVSGFPWTYWSCV